MSWFSSITNWSLFRTSFSKILAIVGNKDIGPYDVLSSDCFAWLWNYYYFSNFPLGTYSNHIAGLKRSVYLDIPFLGNSLRMGEVIRSQVGGFLGPFLMVLVISSGVIVLIIVLLRLDCIFMVLLFLYLLEPSCHQLCVLIHDIANLCILLLHTSSK